MTLPQPSRPRRRAASGSTLDRKTLIEELEETDAGAQEMAAARLSVEVISLFSEALRACGMSQADLSRALGLTEGRVSQVFGGDGNVHVATIGKFFRAMGYQPHLWLEPLQNDCVPLLHDPDSLVTWIVHGIGRASAGMRYTWRFPSYASVPVLHSSSGLSGP